MRPNTGSSKPIDAAEADAGGIVAIARTAPPVATPAAVERKLRRVGSTGAFNCGVLCTRLAWSIGFDPFMVWVRAGAEDSVLPLGLLIW